MSATATAERQTVKKSEADFVQMFLKSRGAEIVTAEATTDANLLRKDRVTGESNPYAKGQVLKSTKISGMIGVNYQNAVNNQREREGKEANFKTQKNWSTPIKGFPFVVHNTKGTIYLSIMVLSSFGKEHEVVNPETGETQEVTGKPVYFDKETGETIPYETIKNMLQKTYKAGKQGLEKNVVWRTYGLGSLDQINMRKLKVKPKGWEGIEID